MPVQRNNLSWLYTTVGFCSLKFSLYLLLCPDSRRPQLDIVVCGGIVHLFAQVFDGTSKRGNLADSCAHRTGSYVRLCAHRKTRRSHRSGSPSPNQPFPHKSVPEHTFHHAIDVLGTQRQSARRGTACSADRRAIRHSIPCRQIGDIDNLTYAETYTMCRNQTHRRSNVPEPPSHACHDIRRPTDMITQRIQVAGYHSVLQSSVAPQADTDRQVPEHPTQRPAVRPVNRTTTGYHPANQPTRNPSHPSNHRTHPTRNTPKCKHRLNFPDFAATTPSQVPRVVVWHKFLTHPRRRFCAAR